MTGPSPASATSDQLAATGCPSASRPAASTSIPPRSVPKPVSLSAAARKNGAKRSQRGDQPGPHRKGGGAQPEMQDRQLEPGAKDRRPADIEPLWNEIEVRRLAEREEARPEPGQVLANEQAPSGPLLPGAVEEHTHRAAGIGQDRAHDRQAARRAIARRNGDLDRVDAAPAGGQPVEHGVRERRGGARAGDRRHAGGAGRCIKARKSGDEIAGVCEIHIVHAGRDRCLARGDSRPAGTGRRHRRSRRRRGRAAHRRRPCFGRSLQRRSAQRENPPARPRPLPPPGRRCGRQ